MNVNIEYYFKRLLVMNDYGVYLKGADGHIWIELDQEAEYPHKFNSIALNNKIYGGVLEAIDTFDAALVEDGQLSLIAQWELWGKDVMFYGNKIGADLSRIDRVKSGQGGIF